MDIYRYISAELSVRENQVAATVKLLEEGATVPFVSRYRKEATGSLDEVQITAVRDLYQKLLELIKRKETVLKTIEELGKLTPTLKKKIESCMSPVELEDIYLPYKPKRKTRASRAREFGLEPLAQLILSQRGSDCESAAHDFVNENVPDCEAAINGAKDIIAEVVSEDAAARSAVRALFAKEACLTACVIKGREEIGEKYRDYFNFSEKITTIPSHRVLALFRAEKEKVIRLDLAAESEKAYVILDRKFVTGKGSDSQLVKEAVADSYSRLIKPSIETEFRKSVKERADNEAISVFASNVRELLLSSPLGQKRILSIDPGYRTGCKVVVLDEKGELLYNTTIYPHPPQKQSEEAARIISEALKKYSVDAVAVGNGTAGRETEQFVREIAQKLPVFLVSEQGASIYSASKVAREEFPDYDVTVRGAVSIGRRLADPLAELVKIDPKSVGVGQYQHDVDQKELKKSITSVVEQCVNSVGVNINTASRYLLEYVSGIGSSLAGNIIEYRRSNGMFKNRSELKKVPKMGEKAFEQCAGFLRIVGGDSLLDNTAVHPESYSIVKKMAADMKIGFDKLIADTNRIDSISVEKYVTESTGLPTLYDIINELKQPGRDPRSEIVTFSFAPGINTIDDVTDGMRLPGIVTNVTKFGAFVDIGIKENGLVHISNLSDSFVSDPAQVVKVNQQVEVLVLQVDRERHRIGLSLRRDG
ncbi:MAG: Tex family protein [Spirochaetes bacterium]|jgi:uncharacterized protein|nr:Tex family protein [Spirochaetota bacterium]